MSPLPPIHRDQRKIDADQLRLLTIFHFIGAGLAIVALLFLLAHFAMFHAFFANPKFWADQKQTPPPAEFFALFKWFYLVAGLWFVISGLLNLCSAFCLRAKRHRTFSIVVAAANCLHLPLGTVLGIFTIIVLQRESVVEVYDLHAQ